MKTSPLKKFSLTLLIMALVSISGLVHAQMHQQCNARFYFGPDSAANSMQFMAAYMAPGTTFAWDFGDGNNGNGQHESHVYAAPGAYFVCLTVNRTDSAGNVICNDHFCDSIHVMPPPPPPSVVCNAHFIFGQHMGSPDIRFMAAMNAPGSTYDWDFGDGSTGSGNNTVHSYTAAGRYWVCLTVTTNDTAGNMLCRDHWCDSVFVRNPPPPPTPHCNAHFFRFTRPDSLPDISFAAMRNWPNASYSWDLGDGTTDTGRIVHHIYSQHGTYYVCLTVTTSDSTGVICTDTWCDSVRTRFHRRPPHHFGQHHHGMINNENIQGDEVERKGNFDQEPTAVIFPNPLTEQSVMQLSNFSSPVTVRIYDNQGKKVAEYNSENSTEISLDKSKFQSGIYFYEVTSEADVLKGKFIVQ